MSGIIYGVGVELVTNNSTAVALAMINATVVTNNELMNYIVDSLFELF